MKANHDKNHQLLSMQNEANIQILTITIKSSSSKKILEITIDNKLRFERHEENLCKKKASKNLNTLGRLLNYMNLTKICNIRISLMNAFLKSQSNYCPLVFGCFATIR